THGGGEQRLVHHHHRAADLRLAVQLLLLGGFPQPAPPARGCVPGPLLLRATCASPNALVRGGAALRAISRAVGRGDRLRPGAAESRSSSRTWVVSRASAVRKKLGGRWTGCLSPGQ